ncbi:MAG: hypothetical protein Q8800_01355 [Candidatus Phytoplasma australasiaticum]|nr:hypothetical protein [Candidatus Phytoplasma australasiaticum]
MYSKYHKDKSRYGNVNKSIYIFFKKFAINKGDCFGGIPKSG